MRFAPLLTIAAALTFASVGMAEAQTASGTTTTTTTTTTSAPAKPTTTKPTTAKVSKPRTKIVITKRSPLDAGTVVKPGSKSYLDYALPAEYNYPTYGAGQASIVPGRYPLPDRFYLPGY
ncbi:hypothetical protein [Roseixanthobacter liquoris]|uniref:hypothetical protein n=1 Tax=Roseixanthobacter liquoris TaxID=3119921 RepID=UPI003727E3C8